VKHSLTLLPLLLLLSLLSSLLTPSPALALEPDEIALIVNRNEPRGAELAQYYAKARNIPGDRIIELDLPTGDQMLFDRFAPDVVRPLREALESRKLREQVKCLVTFYGVPLRVAERANSPQELAEMELIKRELGRVQTKIAGAVQQLEQLARSLDNRFAPLPAQGAEGLPARSEHAMRAIAAHVQAANDPAQRQRIQQQVQQIGGALNAPMGDPPATAPATQPPLQPAPATAPASQPVDMAKVAGLLQQREDPAAREQLRQLTRRGANALAYHQVLQEQLVTLSPRHTDAALDSELALLWVDGYARPGWQPNPLAYPYLGKQADARVIMVMRLDAPRPEQVRQMIDQSLAVERAGLKGKAVIDSRGIAAMPGGSPDVFGQFDQRLRALAGIIESNTKLQLVHDQNADVLPATNPAGDVALYCGWYSVGKYVPGMKFVPGAVGYHIASFELTSLRDETNTGWARGMINDGVAATMGPVSEPLLHAFPVPDDFFPLLLTGELALAEVYWRTCPLTSWKMCMIGDPLYAPYRANPVLRVEDLPTRLRPLFSDAPATQPAAPAATTMPAMTR
jgi:uncharacterized protein (TIGR03790 family)